MPHLFRQLLKYHLRGSKKAIQHHPYHLCHLVKEKQIRNEEEMECIFLTLYEKLCLFFVFISIIIYCNVTCMSHDTIQGHEVNIQIIIIITVRIKIE